MNMITYKIREASVIMSKDGSEAMGKKMVLKADEQQNEEPRVTVWYSDFPEAKELGMGDTISGVMEKKDSGTPIPAHPEKNFINRTLLAESDETFDKKADLMGLEDRVKKLEDKHGPMPSIIRKKMRCQLFKQIGLEYHDLYADIDNGSPAYVRNGQDYGMKIEPLGGPKTKTRTAYDKWIKQKKSKSRIS